jgi:hypothetical protein
MEQSSRGSTVSRSSEDSTSSSLQHSSTSHQSFSNYAANFDHPPAFPGSGTNFRQLPMGPSYATDSCGDYFDGELRHSSSSPESQGQGHADLPAYNTTVRSDPLVPSSSYVTPLGDPIIARSLAPNNPQLRTPLTMNPPNQLANSFPQGPLYQSRIRHDTSHYISPYPGPLTEHETTSSSS